MAIESEVKEDEQIDARYTFGDVEVLITEERVIVDEEGDIESMLLRDITQVVLVKGDTYGNKEGPLRKILQGIGILSKPTYPIKVKFKAALPTARRIHFMTSTEYEEKVEDFHTKVNLSV